MCFTPLPVWLVGIVNDEFYAVTADYVFQFDVTAWGWIHLIAGVIVFFAGVGLLSGQVWARTVGVILAIGSILANFAWLPWYPFWSILMITFGVIVIWALTIHGRDLEIVRST